ncbi:MAG: thioredoxin domain-containing protein [Verrucomicrobiota bacterium]
MNTNRLAQEKSPYLLQHQHNPVDWYPWGEEAFEKARREQKPIFLSIGYSTCHWCHVMERESFENERTAALLNAHFVSIKVDREERPDVDRVYMTFVQATTGSGGWPMSVFLTPELKPFLGGTYFPPDDRWGRPGFPTLLERIATAWEQERAKIEAHGEQMLASLSRFAAQSVEAGHALQEGGFFNPETLNAGYREFAAGFDPELGGFSQAPKFPRPVTLNFLLRYSAANPESRAGDHARQMVLLTLDKMAAGGMHDQLGGGFHRYSVDRFWHVPHFEKMLYDQAQLASAYLDAFQATGEHRYAEVARDVLDYVRRDLTSPEGGFYSAEDADSPLPEDPSEKGEGAFYVWTKTEIDEALGADAAALFNRFYGVEDGGNAPAESDPHGELTGKNTLIQRHTIEEMARLFAKPEGEIARSLLESRRTLFELRERRPRPYRDDKILTAWNGLMISAFARAAQVLGESEYRECAERAVAFIKGQLYREGRLIRSYREGASRVAGFADDYAFLIQGLLDLYETSGGIEWLQWAAQLQQTQDTLFYDAEHGGYWSATADDPAILIRMKEENDGAEPSPNSVAALNAFRLAQMLDDPATRQRGESTLRAFSAQLQRMPSALPQLLVAGQFATAKPMQIVFAGSPDAQDGDPLDLRPLVRELHGGFIPNKVVLFADGGGGQRWLAQRVGFIRDVKPVAGKATAFVCENFTCRAPATTAEQLREALKR